MPIKIQKCTIFGRFKVQRCTPWKGLILLKNVGFLRKKNISFHWGLIDIHFGSANQSIAGSMKMMPAKIYYTKTQRARRKKGIQKWLFLSVKVCVSQLLKKQAVDLERSKLTSTFLMPLQHLPKFLEMVGLDRYGFCTWGSVISLMFQTANSYSELLDG